MNKSLLLTIALLGLGEAPAVHAGDSGLKVIDQIKVGGAGGWDYASFDPASRVLYLSHNTSIAAVNVDTKTVTPHFADASGAHVALAIPGGRSVMITNGKTNAVTINDAHTGAVTATIATDTGPDAAIIEPMTGRAFVMANHGGIVDVVDLAGAKVLAKLPAGGAPEAAAVDGEGMVFTHLEDKNALVAIDAKSMTVKATYPFNDCDEPSGMAFVAKGRLILSACRNGKARVTRADTGEEVVTLPIGMRPDFALYDAQRHLGYIPCGDGTLTVISFAGDRPQVIDTVATRAGARTGALDPASGNLYLPTADFGHPATAGDRPPVLPDTFEVVVVGK